MNKVNILVVDDRPEGLLAVLAVLDSPEYNLVTASSGQEALKCLLEKDFAVILLDVQMPIMNGFETAAIIKTREKSQHIPIIFMSAINQDEQYVYQGYKVGAVDYLLKPFDPYIVTSKVSIFVDIYKKNLLIKEQARKIYEAELLSYAQKMDRMEYENLKRYKHLADSIPQIVFQLGFDGSYDFFNKVWHLYTGLTEKDCVLDGWKKAIHKDDLVKLTNLFNGNSLDKDVYEIECRIKAASNDYRWHLIRMHPENFNESKRSWLGTATDIEERKKAEMAQNFLTEAGAHLISSLEAKQTLEAIASLCVSQFADWCAIDLLDKNELKSISIAHSNEEINRVLTADHLENLSHKDSFCYKVLEEGHSRIFNGPEGSLIQIPLISQMKPVGLLSLRSKERISDTHSTYFMMLEELGRRVGSALENSRLYKLSQDAIQVRNDFLSIASHELNTPITSLKLQLQVSKRSLATNSFNPEKITKSLDSSLRQVDRLIQLIEVLLDVSRIQSGKFIFRFTSFNLHDLVQEVSDRYREVIHSSESSLEIECPESLDVTWDRMRIEQVIINILINSVKYAPGLIKLIVKPKPDSIEICIKDHGEGIPPEKLDLIFNRFERLTPDKGVSGLGLGLFIVKQIVDGHKGTIRAESEIGSGTSFIINLPMEQHA